MKPWRRGLATVICLGMGAKERFRQWLRGPRPITERLRRAGAHVAESVFIGHGCEFDWDFACLVALERGVVLAPFVQIVNHDSSVPNVIGKGAMTVGRVVVRERAYVGQRALILPGVEIGAGAVVGAGSVVTRSVPSGEVWAGVPARYRCTVEELVHRRSAATAGAMSITVDWIGEPEKKQVDYPSAKHRMLTTVRGHFGVAGSGVSAAPDMRDAVGSSSEPRP